MLNIAPECPRCQNDEYYYKPRKRIAGNIIIYERICKQCKQIFYTFEQNECYSCKSNESLVIKSRKADGINIRYRQCKVCGNIYQTQESVIAYIEYNQETMHAKLISKEPGIGTLIKLLFGL